MLVRARHKDQMYNNEWRKKKKTRTAQLSQKAHKQPQVNITKWSVCDQFPKHCTCFHSFRLQSYRCNRSVLSIFFPVCVSVYLSLSLSVCFSILRAIDEWQTYSQIVPHWYCYYFIIILFELIEMEWYAYSQSHCTRCNLKKNHATLQLKTTNQINDREVNELQLLAKWNEKCMRK